MKIINKSFRTYLLLAGILVIGCDIFQIKEPEFEFISKVKEMTEYGRPCIIITVKNIGDGTGYCVSCHVIAKRGSLIVDTGFASFEDLGYIGPGEISTDDAIFFKLKLHSDYDKLEYELNWLTK